MSNPVVSFLTTRNGYTFDEGVAVFSMYVADMRFVERVRRSHNMDLLRQELKKLAHVPGLKPVRNTIPSAPKQDEKVQRPVESVLKEENDVAELQGSKARQEPADGKLITFDRLKHHKYTRFEDMPTPETQALWKRNNQRWHRMLDLFARMKLTNEGEGLAEVRGKLVEESREHDKCWKLIDEKCDEFYAKREMGKTEPEKPSFNISTYRAYICEKANLEKLSDKQFLELQRRVDAMTKAGFAISDETLRKLRTKDIKC